MSNFANSQSVVLKRVRLDFFDAYKPGKPMNEKGKPKYKVKAIIERGSDAEKVAKQAMSEAARALWGENAKNVVPMITANSKCLRDGNGNLDQQGNIRPEYKDKLFISASNESKPQVVGPTRVKVAGKDQPQFVDIHEDGSCSVLGIIQSPPPYKITPPYRGCYVDLKVTMVAGKAFKAASGEQLPNQIFAKFEAIKFVADGEAFGAGPTSAEGFDDEDMPEGGGDDLMGSDGDDLAF